MTTGHIFIATSLDGFVARVDHKLDWLMKQKTENEEHGYNAFIESVDVIIMGRGSYENVLTFGDWPYTKPVIVMSQTLTQDSIPKQLIEKIELTKLDPPELMQKLSKRKYMNAYIDGAKVVQSFIKLGLVKDIILTHIPILIGSGISLFGNLDADIDLKLIASKSFPSSLTQVKYSFSNFKQGV